MCLAYTYMCALGLGGTKPSKFCERRYKNRASEHRWHHLASIPSSLCVLAVLFVVLIEPAHGWHDTYGGHGTTHEQLGQEHYPQADLTHYKSHVMYTAAKNRTSWSMIPVFNFTHFLFDNLVNDKPALPPGYIIVKNGDTLAMGPKVVQNEWSELLAQYWLILIWVFFLVILMVLIPFIAVCYCCFCCCRRCKMGCGPCDAESDKRRSLICAIILVILMLLMLLGAIIAFTSNRALDHGLDETGKTMKRGTEDTCRFLKDVGDHIHHIFVYNYEELEAHLTDMLNNAHTHIFLDLADTSESNALSTLERILDNMKEARRLMRQVDKLEKDLRFFGSQLRDGVRGTKRDINYACANLISHDKCKRFLKESALEFVDSSPCLHFDSIPNTTIFVEGINKIIKDENALIPKRALQRFQELGAKIEVAMSQIIPPMLRDINKGRAQFESRASKIRNLIDAVISDIHFRTIHSTKSFEDIHDKFGGDSSYINAAACVLIMTIAIILIIALICGCCHSKATGANCLLLAIILMFCVFSICVLTGLVYFVFGLVTYQAACAPLRDQEGNSLFRELDAVIDLNRFLPQLKGVQSDQSSNHQALRMSKAIKACMANESIFDLLLDNNLYNIGDLTSIDIMGETDEEGQKEDIFVEDLSKIFLLTNEEMEALNKMRDGDLKTFHSVLFTENLCTPVTPNLASLSAGLQAVRDTIYYDDDWDYWNKYGRFSLTNEVYHLDTYNFEWTDKINDIMDSMKEKLVRVDDLILYENRNFSNSILVLLNAVIRSETFLRERGSHFINTLGVNLTDVVKEQVDIFVHDLIDECNHDVGHCQPLAYIYYRGVDLICYRLVDPMNGFWVGILLAALLLLPLLFVAHKLMCLWKRMDAYAVAAVAVVPEVGGCPTCTGAPYSPPPIIVCGGGQQTNCGCPRTYGDARANAGTSISTGVASAGQQQNDGGLASGSQVAVRFNQTLAQGAVGAPKRIPPTPAAKRKKD